MANVWGFPTSISVNGNEWAIRTDYRVVIDLLIALNDPDILDEDEQTSSYIKAEIILQIMVVDYDSMPNECKNEAVKQIIEFIDMGISKSEKKSNIVLMDWEQDASMIIPAVNRVVGKEIRALEYMHWWTFLSAYMEIGECSYSHILSLRQKKAKGKKLEKWEQEYIRDNHDLVILKKKLSEEEEKERLLVNELLGGKING